MAEYIEREALRREIDRIYQKHFAKSREKFIQDTFKAMFKRIDNAPAANVEPVRHGRWIDVRGEASGMNWKCSKCCKRVMPKYPYCPNCGATMDLEVSDG